MAGAGAGAKTDLVIGISQYPSTLHPNIDSMLAKVYVLGMLRRPLTAYDPRWSLVCLLCEELPSLDAGSAKVEPITKQSTRSQGDEGIAVTYAIDARAVWGDGTPITTDDVIFTWEVGKSPRSGVAGQEAYRRILAIDRHSDKRFTLHVDRVTFDYASLPLELLPAHLEREIFAEDPATYRHRTRFETEPTHPGLHYGPYRLVDLRRGSHLSLVPNPNWWGTAPRFSRITIKAIEKTAALEANLLSGDIDYIAGELGLAIDQALAFEKRHGERFTVQYKPGLIYEHIDFNLDNPILADRQVRQAIMHGVDRDAISEQLFGAKQPVAHSSVSPLDTVYEPAVRRYAYDPKAAVRLLENAGWRSKRAGIRYDERGQRLSLELMTTAGNRTRELVQQVLQSQLRQIGIDIRIRNEPARVFFGETVAKRKFTGLAMYAWISAPESVPRSTLHSEEIPSEANGWSGQNATGYRNPQMDHLLDTIEVELDPTRRKALWSSLQKLYAEELPVMPLYFRANAFIYPKWLAGIVPTGHQYPSTLWVHSWHATAH